MKAVLDLDARISAQLRIAEKPGPLRTLAAVLAHSGDSWFWLAGLAILWLVSGSTWRIWSARMIAAVIFTAVIVLVTKFAVRRRRPEGEWGRIYRSTDPHSFPSGHAARAVMLVVLVAGLGPDWFALMLALWAPAVALARVSMGVHYLSDVLAGGILGALIGAVFGLL
jgi:undecaprenyl-diphosphatase